MLSKETKRKIILLFAPRLIWFVIWIIYAFTRHRFHIDVPSMQKNFVAAFWHGELLMLPFLYAKLKKHMSKEREKGFYVIFSHHFDGEIIARVCELFGLRALRGSSSKGGIKVLAESIRLLKEGYDIGVTPDGPKGPYHSVADGSLAMSMKASVPIVPIRVMFSNFWELKSWDKLKIPKPFCRIDYYAMAGFRLDSTMPMEEAKNLLKAHLASVQNKSNVGKNLA